MNRTPRLLAALTLGLATGLGAQGTTHRLAGSEAAIYNIVGTMTVRGGGSGDVTVTVEPVGRDAGRLTVETDPIDGVPTLRVLYPADEIVYPSLGRGSRSSFSVRADGTWGGWEGDRGRGRGRSRQITVRGNGDGLEAAANLTITIPRGRKVAVFLGLGAITASNLDGTIRLDGAAADIRVDGSKGALTLDTGSGDIEVRDAAGDLSLDTGSGSVRVEQVQGGRLSIDTGSGDVDGRTMEFRSVEISTGSGDIEVTGLTGPDIQLETGSGDVELALTAAPDRVDVETGSGNVTLRVAKDLDATLDLSTSSGEFEVDFPLTLTRRSEDSLTGRIGSGKGRITIETGSGDIAIRP